jgi:hypothetical protein
LSSVETFIVVTALLCSLCGGIILLSSLAGKRAQLVKAFNIQQELQALDDTLDMNESPRSNSSFEDDLDLTLPE